MALQLTMAELATVLGLIETAQDDLRRSLERPRNRPGTKTWEGLCHHSRHLRALRDKVATEMDR